jgi:hypothetical protein
MIIIIIIIIIILKYEIKSRLMSEDNKTCRKNHKGRGDSMIEDRLQADNVGRGTLLSLLCS